MRTKRICSVADCGRPAYGGKGMCLTHRKRVIKYGNAFPEKPINTKKVNRHGLYKTPEYRVWAAMKSRCHNPKATNFGRYGALGIEVCDRWRNSFGNFYADMGPRPSPQHSIDRVDTLLGYGPENCKWSDPKEQANNRRSSRILTVDGVTKTIKQWSEITGISYSKLWGRAVRGWPTERIFNGKPK